jgi:hypothetical protein
MKYPKRSPSHPKIFNTMTLLGMPDSYRVD